MIGALTYATVTHCANALAAGVPVPVFQCLVPATRQDQCGLSLQILSRQNSCGTKAIIILNLSLGSVLIALRNCISC